jgi:glutathione S-transferase
MTVNPDGSFSRAKWEAIKPQQPYEQMPVLTVHGKQLAQSGSIARYIARTHGLTSGDEWEAALIDSQFESVVDLRKAFGSARSDPAKLAEYWSKGVPEAVRLLEKNVLGQQYTGAHNKLSYADVAIYYALWMLRTENAEVIDKALAANPKVKGIFESVPQQEKIKAYLEKRPVTKF